MSLRLILLDVPGVLYSDRSAARLGGKPGNGAPGDMRLFDPVALGFVRRLFGLAGARVVLPSAWSRGVRAATIQQLDLQVQAFAPAVDGGFGAEAAAWLAGADEPQSYVLLTADAASVPAALRPRTLAVDGRTGLTVDDFQRALDMLGVAPPHDLYPPTGPDARVQARLLQLRRAARQQPEAVSKAAAAEPAHA